MTDHTFPLSLLARELASLTSDPVPGQRKLHQLVIDARLPAEFRNGRWFVRRSDLPEIADTLGLPIADRDRAACVAVAA